MNTDKITIGKYINGNSIIHRFDARLKFITLFILITALFFNGGFEPYLFLTIFIAVITLAAKIPWKLFFSPFISLLIIFIFIFAVTIFFSAPNANSNQAYYQYWFSMGSIKVYNQALLRSAYIVWRIYLMIMITTIFTATTNPMNITIAIEDLLKPLKYIKFPVHEIAMIIAIALRFIPTILIEAKKIINSQASRGVDLKNGKFKEKVRSMASLVVPLFVSAFQKAEDLANAMDVRGYDTKSKRTRFRKLTIGFTDILLFFICCAILTFCILYANKHLSVDVFHWWFFGINNRPVFN